MVRQSYERRALHSISHQGWRGCPSCALCYPAHPPALAGCGQEGPGADIISGHGRPDPDNEQLLTPDSVAALLAVSVRSVRRYAEEGRLAPVRIGRNVRYHLADVERLIEVGSAPGGSDTGQRKYRTTDMPIGGQKRSQTDMAAVSATDPIEAAYRVAGEATAEVALVPLATMVVELRGLADQLNDMARRNEALAMEVGQLRERRDTQQEQLVAKYQVIAAQEETIAELRRRAEVAEADLFRQRQEQEAAQAASAAPSAPEAPSAVQAEAPGVWGRVRRWWGGGDR